MATETKTFYPGAYKADSNDYYGMKNATNPVGKGSANTTYASFENRPYQSGIVYWPFDTSIIPAEATIDSVACMAKGSCNSSTKGSMQLYSGTVAKGSATSTKTSAAVYNLSCGTWTRAELDNIRLLTKITNTNSGSSIFYFYGADLTVAYTYQSEKFMLKLGGAWQDIARVFKKVNGIWVEQTELANVIEDGVRYQNGGEYVAPVQKISFTIAGTSYQAEEGMTWGEWVASSYNTAGYQIVYNWAQSGIADASGTKFVYDPENRIFPPSTDAIANGREYTLQRA